jgi:predicted nucleotidyltransferase
MMQHDTLDNMISEALMNFAEKKLTLQKDSQELNTIKNEIDKLKKGLKNKWRGAIEEILIHGSYARNTLLPRRYDPVTDIDILLVVSRQYRHEHRRSSPMFFRKTLLSNLAKLYPENAIKEDFPSIRLELEFIIFDIVPVFFEIEAGTSVKSYLIPIHDLKWEKIPTDTLSFRKNTNSKLTGNLIRLCKHWNASSKYPLKSFYLESAIQNYNHPPSVSLYRAFIDNLYQMNQAHEIRALFRTDHHQWTVGESVYDAFTEFYKIVGVEDGVFILTDIAKDLLESVELKKVRSTTNVETIGVLNLMDQFRSKEAHTNINSVYESHQFSILSQLLLPGLIDNWIGFPTTSKYWKCKNESKFGPQSLDIQRRYDSNGEITNNFEI